MCVWVCVCYVPLMELGKECLCVCVCGCVLCSADGAREDFARALLSARVCVYSHTHLTHIHTHTHIHLERSLKTP